MRLSIMKEDMFYDQSSEKSCATTADVKKQGEVSEQLEKQEALTEKLHKVITNLDERLADVLLNELPREAAKNNIPEDSVVVARKIRNANDLIELATERLRDITLRIEI